MAFAEIGTSVWCGRAAGVDSFFTWVRLQVQKELQAASDLRDMRADLVEKDFKYKRSTVVGNGAWDLQY